MESNRPYLIFIVLLAIAFMFFMFSIKGIRVEKITLEKQRWQEVHFIWDWNKAADWVERFRPRQIEERKKISEDALKETEVKETEKKVEPHGQSPRH